MKPCSRYKNGKTRDWKHPAGKSGDLSDIIVVMLSLISVHHTITKVRLPLFYKLFSALQEEYPGLLPAFDVTHMDGHTYSEALGSALESSLRLGVRIANPRFQYLEVTKEAGERNLGRLRKRIGNDFIENLEPAAKRLAELAKEERTVTV